MPSWQYWVAALVIGVVAWCCGKWIENRLSYASDRARFTFMLLFLIVSGSLALYALVEDVRRALGFP